MSGKASHLQLLADAQQTNNGTYHVLSVARVTLDHHAGWLKGGIGDLSHRQLLMVGLLSRDDRRIGRQHEVDSGVRHQVGLELSNVHIQGTIEAQGRRQGGDDLSDKTVQVRVGGTCREGNDNCAWSDQH